MWQGRPLAAGRHCHMPRSGLLDHSCSSVSCSKARSGCKVVEHLCGDLDPDDIILVDHARTLDPGDDPTPVKRGFRKGSGQSGPIRILLLDHFAGVDTWK